MMEIVLFGIECRANKKRRQIDEIRQQVYVPLKKSNIKEAAAMGTAAVGLSLFEVYATMNKHADLLDVLEQRFPKAHGDKNIWDWYGHLSDNIIENADSLESYVSCFKGQAAENCAIELLREQGLDASLFDSLTNETNDIMVSLDNGNMEYYSVKCGDVDYIKNCIENTDANNYIINSESYAELNNSGLLDIYEKQGVTIIDGNYSDNQLTYMAEGAFEEIGEAGDVTDTIPYLALACLGIKTYKNVKNLMDGKQSKNETLTNFGVDVAKVGEQVL